MAECSVFNGQYSDLEYSEPESDDSDFDPANDVSDSEPAGTGQAGANYHFDTQAETGRPAPKPQSPLSKNVKTILTVIAGLGLSVASFLDGLSWGDAACTSDDEIRTARTQLLNSPQLPDILRRWHKPPRPAKSKGARPKENSGAGVGTFSRCLQIPGWRRHQRGASHRFFIS
ncbi:hypothetical protein B0H10DRAFT_1940784 [Mycena sp. CBHHK59/15]|nr:hypothetical protein B0H10DRAFT_1940784 [Mycena sp. CBHHK59/15]